MLVPNTNYTSARCQAFLLCPPPGKFMPSLWQHSLVGKMLAARAVALACALVGSAAYTVVPDTAINLVGDSSDAANRMEARKAEMAKMQEQRLAEREKMKAQKEEMRAAEKARKQLQKTGSVTPSPAPEEKEDKAEPAFEKNPKHSAEWNAKRKKEMKLASKHSDEWNAKHAATEKETSSSATSSKKEVKEASSASNDDAIQDDASVRQPHTWEWRHRDVPCKGKPCKDAERQESDH